MSDAHRTLRAALWAVTAFALVYPLQTGLALPGLVYDPHARDWSVGVATGTQMRYFGDLLAASSAAALAALLGRALPLRTPLDVAAGAGAAVALVLFDVVFFLSRVLAW